MATAVKQLDEAAIMAVLDRVPDPEIPAPTIPDLGIVRRVAFNPPRVQVTPTYTGCPATVAIEQMIRLALDEAGFAGGHTDAALFPARPTASITERAQQRLKDACQPP